MASPQVAGAAALILSVAPRCRRRRSRRDILENVDKLPVAVGQGDHRRAPERVQGDARLRDSPTAPPRPSARPASGAIGHFATERKRVNRYALPTAGSVTKLSIYLAPTATSGQQVLKGVIYADNAGAPAALLGVIEQLTFTSTNTAGWYDLTFASPLKLARGQLLDRRRSPAPPAKWLASAMTASAGSRDYNANTYSAGPSNPFGAVTTDNEQTSLYATYTRRSSDSRRQHRPTDDHRQRPAGPNADRGPRQLDQQTDQLRLPVAAVRQPGTGCLPITGATSQSYVPWPATSGTRSGSRRPPATPAARARRRSSAATAAVLPPPPANTAPPTISGTAQQGQTLTEDNGSWTNEPTSFAYQWQQCDSSGASCVAISGATSQTYVPVAADVGHTLRVQETASNAGGASTPGELERHGGRRAAAAGEHRPADDQRHRPAGPDADRGPRQLDQQPDELRLPVAAVRQPRQRLPADRRRHRQTLCARGRRRRAHAQGPGDREQRRRRGQPGELSATPAVLRCPRRPPTPPRRRSAAPPSRARR